MADNVTTQTSDLASIPTSTTIATDDAGAGGHVQIVKLAVSTDGSATALQADNTNGLLADVKRVQGTVTVAQSTASNLKVDASGATVPVSDASGSLTVDAPVSTPVFVRLSDGSSAISTLPVSLATNQPAGNVASGATDSGNPLKVGGKYNSSSITLTDGQRGDLQLDASGYVKVNVAAGSASNAAAGSVDSSVPSSADYQGVSVSGTLKGATAVSAGSHIAQTVAIVDSSGNQISSFGGSGGTAITDDAAFTIATTSVTPAAGVYKSTVDAVDDGDAGAFHMTARRAQHVSLRKESDGSEMAVAATAPAFVRLSDGSSAISTLPVSLASVPSHAVTNAGTFAVQESGSALTALQLIDDGVYTDDTSTHSTGSSKGYAMMAAATPTDTSVNANDFGIVAMTTDRKLHVSVRDSLPAGTNAIGKLAANSGVDIGDIDVTSIIPGTSASNLGKAEDAAHSSGDVGVMALAVRQATTPTDRSAGNTNGDYEPLQVDGNGRLYVNATLYDSSGSAITPDTQGTQDGALGTITSVTGGTPMRRASTAAPSAVSADDDAVLPWHTRNGAAVVTTVPHTVAGLSTFMASGSDGSSILVATAQAVKASAGQVYGYYLYNPEAAVTFVHFYNTAQGSVTVGTTNPLFSIQLPAGAAANMTFPFGVAFSTAITIAATTTAGGNTAPSTGVSATIWYA